MIWLLTTYAIFSQLFFTINFQLTCASFDQWWEREQILGGKGSSGWSFPETFIPSEWSQPSAAADCSRTCYSLKERWMSVVAQCCWGVCFLFSWLVLWTCLPSAFERGIVSGLCISPTGAGWMRMMGWMCDKRTGGLERKIKTWLQYRVGAFFVCFFLSFIPHSSRVYKYETVSSLPVWKDYVEFNKDGEDILFLVGANVNSVLK